MTRDGKLVSVINYFNTTIQTQVGCDHIIGQVTQPSLSFFKSTYETRFGGKLYFNPTSITQGVIDYR